jgi:hypothetical protein
VKPWSYSAARKCLAKNTPSCARVAKVNSPLFGSKSLDTGAAAVPMYAATVWP